MEIICGKDLNRAGQLVHCDVMDERHGFDHGSLQTLCFYVIGFYAMDVIPLFVSLNK